jgi:hypothetical protein
MIASVHMCDSGVLANLTRLAPKPAKVDGLRWCRKALCAEPSPGATPSVQLGRGGIMAWWNDDASLDAFLAAHPNSAPFRDGWSVRLRPTRSRAKWPNADFDAFPEKNERHDGVHVALTLGNARIPTFPRFMKVSGNLEEQFVKDDEGLWGLAMTLPPRIVMTMTFWSSQDATDHYIHSGAHGAAIKDHYDLRTDVHEFVADGGFFGFQPYAMTGSLTGKNPTPANLLG